jgi:hypothetical protein
VRRGRSAEKHVLEEGLDLDVRPRDEVRMIRLREEQKPAEYVLDTRELVERHLDLLCVAVRPRTSRSVVLTGFAVALIVGHLVWGQKF